MNRTLAMVLLCTISALANGEIFLEKGVGALDPVIKKHLEKRLIEEDPDKLAAVYVSQLLCGDINGDGDKDSVVLYAVEGIGGGNFSLLFISLFENDKGRLVLRDEIDNGSFGMAVGSTFVAEEVRKGEVLGTVAAYAEGDGVCCPSIKKKARLRYVGGKLKAQ